MIYLDNAATTFPKAPEVSREVAKCLDLYCGNPGRGAHYMSRAASEKLLEVRYKLKDMFSPPSVENVVFTLNTTYAINIAVRSMMKKGAHVLISDLEHNSVLRCVDSVCRSFGGEYEIFHTFGGDGDRIVSDIEKRIKPNTSMLVSVIASNVCPTVLPFERIGKLCRNYGIFYVADAAQSAGIIKTDIMRSGIGALCLPAHKGFYSPQGIACMIFGECFPETMNTVIQGGSGSYSADIDMPPLLPDRYEAGTMPTPAAAGFSAGIDFIKRNGEENVRRHEAYLSSLLASELSSDKAIKLYGDNFDTGIVTFNLSGLSPVYIASELDKLGICVRAGLHCSPLAHKTLGTGESGAVRVSFGAFNERRDVYAFCDALNGIKKGI